MDGGCGVTGGEVNALAVIRENLFVGGGFTEAGGHQSARLARWDGRQWYSFGTPNGDVNALAVLDGQLLVGGDFTMIEGVSFNHIAGYRSGSWQHISEGVGGSVYTIAVLNSCLYVGGDFTEIAGESAVAEVPIKNAARWCVAVGGGSESGWLPIDWGDYVDEIGVCTIISTA